MSRIGFNILAIFIERTLGIEKHHVLALAAIGKYKPGDSGIRGASPQQDNLGLGKFLARKVESIEQSCQGDARRSLCVIVPNGDIACFP